MAENAKLKLLIYQINPHFLFNSLSSLRALIRENSSKAEHMVTQISEFLRYSLESGKSLEVPLSDEIKAVQHYLDIERIRFGKKLNTNFEIDTLAEYYPVPNLILHPIVENAIKYGMDSSIMPLKINLKADVIEDNLILEVSNSGSWVDSKDKSGTGTGLENIKSRLEQIYPHNHNFEIIMKNGFVVVKLEIRNQFPNNNNQDV